MQHVQKALEQLNLKLTEVLSDITGLSGRTILRAILRGTRAPEKLAKSGQGLCGLAHDLCAKEHVGEDWGCPLMK